MAASLIWVEWLFLFGKADALHVHNSSTEAYLCNQCGIVSFSSRLAHYILHVADKHGYLFIPAYISIHLSAEADYLV